MKVLAAGSSASIATITAAAGVETTGAASALANLISIGTNSQTAATSDQTGLSDTTIVKYPARVDPGTVQLEFFLDDTATASNQLTSFRTKLTSRTKCIVTVDFTGSAIDTLLSYTGYVTDVTTPNVAASDDTLRYTVTLTLSSALPS